MNKQKKKGFIIVYVLIILLVVAVIFSFFLGQIENNKDLNDNLLDRKQLNYDMLSTNNLVLEEKYDLIKDFMINTYSGKSEDQARKEFSISYKDKTYSFILAYLKETNNLELDDTFLLANKRTYSKKSATLLHTYLKAEINPILDFEDPPTYEEAEEEYDKVEFTNEPIVKDELIIKDKSKDSEDIKKESDNNKDRSNDEENDKNEASSDVLENDSSNENEDTSDKEKIEKDKEEDIEILDHGVINIEGDLILEDDFTFEGILIVKGNVKTNGHKLNIRGQFIGHYYDNDDIKIIRDKKVTREYIANIDDLVDFYTYAQKFNN